MLANEMEIGYIFQEEESDGIPEESDLGKIKGRRSSRDARATWSSCAWTKALRNFLHG